MANWSIPNRVLVAKKFVPGKGMPLADVSELFTKMDRLKNPEDILMPAKGLHVEFRNGQLVASRLTQGGVLSGEYRFLRVGARTLAAKILPSRGLSTLYALADIDDKSAQLATLAWAKFASQKGDSTSRVRFVNVSENGKAVRAVRSVHGGDYAPYSNTQFTRDIIRHGKHFAQNEVLHYAVTDEVMRLRLRGKDMNGLIPVTECWNSEVGQRSIIVRSGLYNPRTDGLIGHWSSRSGEKRWVHRGNANRIAKEVQSAFEKMYKASDAIRDAYEAAMDAAIDDAMTWMEEILESRLTQPQIKDAKNNITHGAVTRGSKVATVVDAITLVAGKTSDPDEAYKIEKAAGEALYLGLAESRKQKKAA